MYNWLNTSHKKVHDPAWVQTCDDLVTASQDLEGDKKQLTTLGETLRNKYYQQPELKKLHATLVQTLQCLVKDSSHTDVHLLLQHLDTTSHLSLSGRVIQREFGEQFPVLCEYLRNFSAYVRKDPTTDEYMVQAIPKPRLIQHKYLALHDTLSQLKETAYIVEQIKAKLGENPTEEQLDHYLSSQPQEYTYMCIELYQHSTDDGTKIGLHHSYKALQENTRLWTSQEEDDKLVCLPMSFNQVM